MSEEEREKFRRAMGWTVQRDDGTTPTGGA